MTRGPIFIAGIERSGTSLIYALLASHPAIAMTRRTNLWRYFYGRYGDLSVPENFERCLTAMMGYKRLLKLEPDPARLRREFWQGEPTYPRLFALLKAHHAERLGKTRWGDKSLTTERYVDLIFEAYPDAKMIHMVRDPRDRYASALKRWKVLRGGVGAGIAMWLDSARRAERNQQHYPDRYRILRYETLAMAPEATLRDLCAFLGEEYSPAMLTMEGAPVYRRKGGNSSYGAREPGRISTSSIGRYRQMLKPHEIAFMQRRAGREMALLGYELDPLEWSTGEQLRFYTVEGPAHEARLQVWRLLQRYRDWRGRTPSAHTLVPRAVLSQT